MWKGNIRYFNNLQISDGHEVNIVICSSEKLISKEGEVFRALRIMSSNFVVLHIVECDLIVHGG